MKCQDEPEALCTVPVHCWRCETKIGQVPALRAWSTPATKREISVLYAPARWSGASRRGAESNARE
jgi:hypothetical protein